MKQFLLLIAFLPFAAAAQTFHFEDTCATIVKNTTQSPAHWYLEIINDLGTDTMLRWKTSFQDIPEEWNINFSTQTASWDTVHHGDSADFLLEITGQFPQKLIIGAATNNTPGHGTVFFDIYDPDAPAVMQTICYEFVITPVLGIDAPGLPEFVRLKENTLEVTNGRQTTLKVYAIDGQLLLDQTRSDQFSLNGIASQAVVLQLRQNDANAIIRTFIP